MIVLFAWLAAVLVAAVMAAVLAFEVFGHARRLGSAVREVGHDVVPRARELLDRLPAPPGGADAQPGRRPGSPAGSQPPGHAAVTGTPEPPRLPGAHAAPKSAGRHRAGG